MKWTTNPDIASRWTLIFMVTRQYLDTIPEVSSSLWGLHPCTFSVESMHFEIKTRNSYQRCSGSQWNSAISWQIWHSRTWWNVDWRWWGWMGPGPLLYSIHSRDALDVFQGCLFFSLFVKSMNWCLNMLLLDEYKSSEIHQVWCLMIWSETLCPEKLG